MPEKFYLEAREVIFLLCKDTFSAMAHSIHLSIGNLVTATR